MNMYSEKKYTLSANRLKEALADAGLIAQDLANKSGIAKASISHYLNGYYCPTLKKAKKMADVLNVSAAWLMGFDVPKYDIMKSTDAIAPDLMYFGDDGPMMIECLSPRDELLKRMQKYADSDIIRITELLDIYDKMKGGDSK